MGEFKKRLELKKNVMILSSNVGRDTSCRILLKTLNILPLPCMYMMQIAYCIKNEYRQVTAQLRHNYNTMNSQNIHQHNKYLLEHTGYMFQPVNRSSSGLQQNKSEVLLKNWDQ